MKVRRITPRGYCHGVVEAIRIARRTAVEQPAGSVTMLGLLVHNEHVTRDLEQAGVALIDTADRTQALRQVDEGTVIITAHGVAPVVAQTARQRGLNVVDATCSDVRRTHDLVRRLVADGFEIVYLGKRGHPEPAGVLGIAPEHITLIESVDEVALLDYPAGTRLAVTCQTTLSMWDTEEIIDRVVERFPGVEVHNDICPATQQRQEAAVLAAQDVDAVVVVGSRRSSNSVRLVQVVRERGHKPAYLVDTVEDLDSEWFRGIGCVGVTAGASTPTQLTRAVIAALEAMPELAA
jgi:4-hydroxy-3-methylbut-2-enyl diphosphate reductase